MARFTKAPILGRLVDYAVFDGDGVVYLPKDNVIRMNEPIQQPENLVMPSAVVEYFIEEAKYHWIMDFCICRDSNGCQDYPTSYGCIFMGEAVLKINPELGRLATKSEALDHLQRCREAGLVHMIGRNKLDTLWLGATPAHKLLTVCNCCPCCCLWKMLPHLDSSISRKVTKMPGVTTTVTDGCKGCKLCVQDVCFVNAIHMDGKLAVIDADQCRGCGRCVEVCPLDAIELTVTGPSFMDETIGRISPLVDIS
jgi:ferredoxin